MQTLLDNCLPKLAELDGQARRLFHGRGHMYSGLEHMTVNCYPPYLLIACHSAVGREQIDAIVKGLIEAEAGVQGIAIQYREGRSTRTEIVWGDVPDEHIVYEHNLKYIIQPKRNQNVGLFLDMGHLREYLQQFMQGAKVLNLFSYTCAFSVSAIDAGAELVVNNDMSSNALALGERNHLANGHDLRKVRMLPHNLFKSWWKVRQLGLYDIVIIDPPTNQRGSFVAEKSYGQILKRLPEFSKPGARIIACLNSPFLGPDFLTQQMQRWCPTCELQQFLPPHPDFPDKFPERGLKIAEFIYRG